MSIDSQIQLFLMFIVAFYIFIICLVIKKFNYSVKTGLDIGDEFPHVEYQSLEGVAHVIDRSFFGKFRLFIFLDTNCKECSKVLKSLTVMKKEMFDDLKIILTNTDDNIGKMSEHQLKSNSILMSPNIISEDFKLNSFPFYIKVDASGFVIDRGYISSSNVMGSINEQAIYESIS